MSDVQRDRPKPSKPSPSNDDNKPLVEALGDAVYSIRWGLVPMYLGLFVAMLAYNVWFFIFEVRFLLNFQAATGTTFLMWILGLTDIGMIGQLMVMTTIGGYSTFVREFDLTKLEGKPRWMNGLDSSQLKIKTSMSLVIVCGIHLLQTFMEADHVSVKAFLIEIATLWTFMFMMLFFTFNARLMHGNAHNAHP